MTNPLLPFILLLVFVFLSRFISNKANEKLNNDKKAELVDLFSKSSNYTYLILIGIVLVFFANIHFKIVDATLGFILYVIAMVAYIIVISFQSYEKLKSHNFPDDYIKTYLVSTAVRLIGLVIFFVMIFSIN